MKFDRRARGHVLLAVNRAVNTLFSALAESSKGRTGAAWRPLHTAGKDHKQSITHLISGVRCLQRGEPGWGRGLPPPWLQYIQIHSCKFYGLFGLYICGSKRKV